MAGHDSARTGRLGVICVDRIVTEELGWIFREQPTADYGIDAQIEICEGGRPTGRLIAVQIKSGSSWFARGDAEGFTYTGSLRHLDYWLEHSLPVILVLCDPAERRAYWTPVERGHVRRGGSSWSIRVPRVSELSALSAEELRRLARPGRMDSAAAANLTAESWRHGCERMESHDSPEEVARIAARFERLWKCSEPVSNS